MSNDTIRRPDRALSLSMLTPEILNLPAPSGDSRHA
jgi:hypothetical protein